MKNLVQEVVYLKVLELFQNIIIGDLIDFGVIVKEMMQKKNTFADEKVREIMRGAVWLNLHLLPHNVTIFEIRNNLGYGARWGADGAQFRGFLEPQMEDGHEKGWKH